MNEQIDQSTPPAEIVDAVEAIAETVTKPTIPLIADDLILAFQLANEVKQKLSNKHPQLMDYFKAILGLL